MFMYPPEGIPLNFAELLENNPAAAVEVLNAAELGAAEGGAAGAEVAVEAVVEGLALEEAESSILTACVPGLVAGLAAAGIIEALKAIFVTEAVTIKINNRTKYDLHTSSAPKHEQLYIQHGKQLSEIPDDGYIGGNKYSNYLGTIMFQNKQDALYGTTGGIWFHDYSNTIALAIGWDIPYSGDNGCGVALSSVQPGESLINWVADHVNDKGRMSDTATEPTGRFKATCESSSRSGGSITFLVNIIEL